MPSAESSVPACPQLAPGLRVVRRGRDHLQVGLYAGRRAVLPRSPVTEQTLALVLHRQPVTDEPAAARVLALLHHHGCLLDAETARASAKARRRARVAVLGRLPGADPVALLEAADVEVAGGWTSGEVGAAGVVLVLSPGELDRDRLDPLIRSGTPHVVVRLVDGGAVLGPFVQPDYTACLRCVDAHESVVDPAHVAVTARYARATALPRADGVPDLIDPTLAVLAVAWAVRDVVAHLEGRQPSTWSRTVRLGPDPTETVVQRWLRHPTCACSWSPSEHSSGTMET